MQFEHGFLLKGSRFTRTGRARGVADTADRHQQRQPGRGRVPRSCGHLARLPARPGRLGDDHRRSRRHRDRGVRCRRPRPDGGRLRGMPLFVVRGFVRERDGEFHDHRRARCCQRRRRRHRRPSASTTRARSWAPTPMPRARNTASCLMKASSPPSTPRTRPATPRGSPTSTIAAGSSVSTAWSPTATSWTNRGSFRPSTSPASSSTDHALGHQPPGRHRRLLRREPGPELPRLPARQAGPVQANRRPRRGGNGADRINDDGQIVGFYNDTANAQNLRGFLLDRGRFTRIDVPGAQPTRPNGIDNHGAASSASTSTPRGTGHGFLRNRDGDITTDRRSRRRRSPPISDLNDSGQMVGWYIDSEGRVRGFRRDESGAVTTIDAPGAV